MVMSVKDVLAESMEDRMPTLSGSMNNALKEGYAETFKVDSKGLTTVEDKDVKHYRPGEIRIANFYRFEGFSDPQDNCILYLIETSDGRKGTLIDAYGAYSDERISAYLRKVEDIQRKIRKENK
jgi:hypothetical protein